MLTDGVSTLQSQLQLPPIKDSHFHGRFALDAIGCHCFRYFDVFFPRFAFTLAREFAG